MLNVQNVTTYYLNHFVPTILPSKYSEKNFLVHQKNNNAKNPHQMNDEDSSKKGDDILSHITAVPSAQAGLTTLFGMGRGEPRRNNHLKRL